MSHNYNFRQIFWQSWRDLVFIHWEVDPSALAAILPPELEPDLFDGKAYVGLVPFRMTGIRSVWLPPVPGTSRTLETNVRTYVRRCGGGIEPVPAVWFFSLEAESTLAVTIARVMYGLPYFKASMRYEKERQEDGRVICRAESTRMWPRPLPARSRVEVECVGDAQSVEATPGSLEHFLVERYGLYAQKGGRLMYAQVMHSPYRIKEGVLRGVDPELVKVAGITGVREENAPLVHLADDVVVRIGRVQRVG